MAGTIGLGKRMQSSFTIAPFSIKASSSETSGASGGASKTPIDSMFCVFGSSRVDE